MKWLRWIATAALLQVAPAVAQTAMPAQDFAARAAVASMVGIESATLALHKTGSPEIKSFAHRLANVHGVAGSGLRQILARRSDIALPQRPEGRHLDQLRDLAAMQGPEFERAYVAAQRAAQAETLALVTTYKDSGTDPELRAFAEETLPTLQELNEKAQALPMPPQ
ncbi:hypothetical protein IP69_01820 [Bosea sp. AAP35]|uniref:DUF4142 domain-containing protein n=1 Tax=Bosea sp. AAP35 TaxID=1523417 RepID=UPI0006B8E926|nr:DUF4142 domain-containing protein [Bosea sp. AAP35]KPF72650.1 hypothetical protein IP69_01820 [Bosea sp. AAP35]